MKRIALFILLLAGLGCTGNARAVLPENGWYANHDRPGLGWYIEVQGTTVMAVAYAHDAETGALVFYTASGQLEWFDDMEYGDGHNLGVETTLYRYKDGPCITCNWVGWDTSEHAEAAGTVRIVFFAHNWVNLSIDMLNGNSLQSFNMKRYKYGRDFYDLPYIATDVVAYEYLSDLKGVWLFTQPDVEDAPVWRFRFSEVKEEAPFNGTIFGKPLEGRPTLVFQDAERNAQLVCFFLGCGLVHEGKTVASFYYDDVAQDSMFGYAPPTDPDAEYRAGHHVIGLRVPDLAPEMPVSEVNP